jgi:isochorismate synthase EntC
LYAGAVGFVDTQTAEFAVAIRSALVTATRATVYGGAGIVEASDPLEEWNETSWKMRPLLAALGCAPR